MDKAHPLISPMVVGSLDVKKNKDHFRHPEEGEELFGLEYYILVQLVLSHILQIVHG